MKIFKPVRMTCDTVLATALGLALILTTSSASAQNVTFGSAQTITGDANLIDATTLSGSLYVDAILPNGNYSSPIGGNGSGNGSPTSLTADGVTFNALTPNATSFGDGTFSFAASSGGFNSYGNNGGGYPTSGSASSAFAAVMSAGGLYMFSGASGAGVLTISSSALTTGHTYDLQIFNFSNVGGVESTVFTSANSVSLADQVGQFTTGTFTATGANVTINFTQDALNVGSGYTPVIGAISLFDVSAVPEPSTYALMLGGMLLLVLGLRNRRQPVV